MQHQLMGIDGRRPEECVMLQILVDRKKCAGLGLCEAEDPDVFEVQDEGVVRILRDRPGPEHEQLSRQPWRAAPPGAQPGGGLIDPFGRHGRSRTRPPSGQSRNAKVGRG